MAALVGAKRVKLPVLLLSIATVVGEANRSDWNPVCAYEWLTVYAIL
jgi:hypothetical protein